MQDIQLQIQLREERGRKNNQLRREGKVPGVVYGKGKDSRSITVDAREIASIYSEAGSNKLVSLVIDGKEDETILFHDVQINAIRQEIDHFDLYVVNMKEKIRADVPLQFEGDAPAVYNFGGTLLTSLDSVTVEALPADLPESIVIDLSKLAELNDAIHVKDIETADTVEIVTDEHATIALVQEAREEEIEEVVVVEDEESEEGAEGEAAEGDAEGAEGEKEES